MGNADLSSLIPARVSDACMRVSRLIEKHIPKQQKTNFIYAMAEKLEMAPPEVFTAEVHALKYVVVEPTGLPVRGSPVSMLFPPQSSLTCTKTKHLQTLTRHDRCAYPTHNNRPAQQFRGAKSLYVQTDANPAATRVPVETTGAGGRPRSRGRRSMSPRAGKHARG